MQYKKIEGIAYNLHLIKTDKFKKNLIKINFKNKFEKEDIVKRRLIPNILVESNSIYNTKRLLDIKTEDLYNLNTYSDVTLSGNIIITSFTASFLNDKYSEEGLLEDVIKFMCDLIFKPNVIDNKFDSNAFKITKNILKEEIESIKENPNEYSLERLLEEMAPDTPLKLHNYGYIDDLEEVTEESLYEYYQHMLNSDIVDVFVIGNIDFSLTEEYIRKHFKIKTKKRFKFNHYIEHKKFRNKYKIIKEQIDNNQSVLLLGYKLDKLTTFEREYVLPIYSYILGGGADSKLFKNVREKNSLCYSISSRVRIVSNIMYISSGINAKDYDKALSIIKKQVQSMEKGDFDESDIEKAKITYISAYKEVNDSIYSIVNNYITHEYLDTDFIDEKEDKIIKVTKQDIMKLIPKIHKEMVFFLEGTCENEENTAS